MKKVFFIAALALVTVFGLSATVMTSADSDSNYSFSLTASPAGMDEDFEFDATTLVAIYNLMPDKVKSLCIEEYEKVAPKIEECNGESFTYAGVKITPITTDNGTDLKFTYKGHTAMVKNYSKAELDKVFGL
jgi:hypothetical protein